jgi:hypothetical protein
LFFIEEVNRLLQELSFGSVSEKSKIEAQVTALELSIENLWKDLRAETDDDFRKDIKDQIKSEKNIKENLQIQALNCKRFVHPTFP